MKTVLEEMRKIICILLFPFGLSAQADTITVNEKQYVIELTGNEVKISKLNSLEKIAFPVQLTTDKLIRFGSGPVLSQSDSSTLDNVYGFFGIKPEQLKSEIRFANEPLNQFLNQSIRQKEAVKPESNTNLILYSIIGVLTLLSAYLFFMAKKKNTTDTENLDDLFQDYQKRFAKHNVTMDASKKRLFMENMFDYFQSKLDLDKELDKLESDLVQAKEKNTALEQDVKTYRAELANLTERDQVYFKHLLDRYISPFDVYFDRDTTAEPEEKNKQAFVSNLLPLAFHFMSFVKFKLGRADATDKQNVAKFYPDLDAKDSSEIIGFDTKRTETNNLLLLTMQLLEEYNATELPGVIVKNKVIKNG